MDGHSGLDAGKVSKTPAEPEYTGPAAAARRWRHHRAKRWERCQVTSPPPLPGVYALFSRGTLMYIGSTDQLARRLRHHRSHGQDTREARFSVESRAGHWLEREYRLLARLRPPGNTRIPRHRR